VQTFPAKAADPANSYDWAKIPTKYSLTQILDQHESGTVFASETSRASKISQEFVFNFWSC